MKKLSSIIILFFCIAFANASDTTLLMAKTKIAIKGDKASTIKLVNFANEPIGNMITYTSITPDAIIFSQYQHYKKERIDFVCIQTITPSSTIGLVADITIKISFENADMKTNPKQYWEVSIAFKQKNGAYVDVGSMVEYRLGYNENYITKKVNKESYTGTTRLLPFLTKAAAQKFVTEIKKVLKSN